MVDVYLAGCHAGAKHLQCHCRGAIVTQTAVCLTRPPIRLLRLTLFQRYIAYPVYMYPSRGPYVTH